MNDFSECLAQSHAASDLPFWKQCYESAFPTMVAMIDHRQNGDHQKAGIDRSIVLANSKQILIDEKVRGRNKKTGKVYEDIALEEWSNEARRVPGWVVKPLLSDYIAYAIAPIGKCYLLPVIQLQNAWYQNSDVWKTKYREVRAPNKGYWTISWAIPPEVLYPAVGSMLRTTFEKYELDESDNNN